MTGADLRDRDYLEHILAALDRIRRYVASDGRNGFFDDEKTQDAVMRNPEIIGEAAGKLSTSFRATHAEIPWRVISGMRNRLIHGYMTVSLAVVWDTVERVLPEFENQVRQIRAGLR